MMHLVSAQEMQEIDRASIEEFGIPSDLLMYTAGKEAADLIITADHKVKAAGIFCGQGNNGGDGFVIAWLLFLQGYDVKIFFNGKADKLSPESSKYHMLCTGSGIEFTNDADEAAACSIIVDALLGTGFRGTVRDRERGIIDSVNASVSYVYSIDMPSGLNSDGEVSEETVCVAADETLTIGLPKINQFISPGKNFCGKVSVLPNIFPSQLLNLYSKRVYADRSFFKNDPACFVFEKKPDTNKFREGGVHITAGSPGMEGAAILCASSLFNTGCGISKLFCAEESRRIIAGKIPELMTVSTDNLTAKDIISDTKYGILLAGSGAGRTATSNEVFDIFTGLVKTGFYRKAVIDGDWLFMLSGISDYSFEKNCRVILTPHDGEGARLLKMESADFIRNRLVNAERIAQKYCTCVVLKGPDTIITDGFSAIVMNAGNESLAAAGSGDVLAGIIASVFIKIDDPLKAAAAAVSIHGRCAEILTENRCNKTIKSSDILNVIQKAVEDMMFFSNNPL